MTRLFLESWKRYNEGNALSFDWFEADELKEYLEDHLELYEEELFISDIDDVDDIGIEFQDLEYQSIDYVIDACIELDNLDHYDAKTVVAIAEMESISYLDAINKLNYYSVYDSIEDYNEYIDEEIQYQLDQINSNLSYYFDWNQWHRDCSFDVFEASNGIVLI